jgi:hypothetical protein
LTGGFLFLQELVFEAIKVLTLYLQFFLRMKVPDIKTGKSKKIKWQNTHREKNQTITSPIHKPRKDWEKAFREMADNEEDRLLFDDVFEDENL